MSELIERTKGLTLIPEWERQDLVAISWPHAQTDWADILEEVEACYMEIARTILRYEDLLILTPEVEHVRGLFEGEKHPHRLFMMEMPSNDTWIRDYGPLAFRLEAEGEVLKCIGDFTFNGWGMKFAADKDNLLTRLLYLSYAFRKDVNHLNRLSFVLEGGSVESDGRGTILSTYNCLFEPNRNPGLEEGVLEEILSECLGADRLLLLKNGELEGDDTDGHVDTLARFVSPEIIAYVACDDPSDVHYHPLKRMEQELRELTTPEGKPYQLVPLPLPKPIFDEDGERLPATYANFLFVNGALIVPTYAQDYDAVALERLREVLPEREVVGVDCRALIRQHGSLHCATMQIPEGFVNQNKWLDPQP